MPAAFGDPQPKPIIGMIVSTAAQVLPTVGKGSLILKSGCREVAARIAKLRVQMVNNFPGYSMTV
jgi:hypothetical protein